MGSERWLDNHLRGDLALQQVEPLMLGEALRAVHVFSLHLEYLVTYNKRLAAVAPLDNLCIAFHLDK